MFLEAGSFKLSTDLGPNRLIDAGTSLCEGNKINLDATEPDANSYKWFKNNNLIASETNASLDVTEPGTYNVEIKLDNSCVSYGEVTVEVSPNPIAIDSVLIECDQNQDGLTFYNLYDAEESIVDSNEMAGITNFFLTENGASQNVNPIEKPTNFKNTSPFQTVFTRVENSAGCFEIAKLELQISNNILNIPTIVSCDGEVVDGIADFNLNEAAASFESQIPTGASVSYYLTEKDAFLESYPLGTNFQNSIADFQTIFVKVKSNNQCYSISAVNLEVLCTPLLMEDETAIYCSNSFPEPIRITGGILNDLSNNHYYEWQFNGSPTGVTTSFYDANEAGNYTVTVTNPNGCGSSRTITVEPSNIPTIADIQITEGTRNNIVTVITSEAGDYDYAMDNPNGIFQGSETFSNVTPGFHTVYVRDLNGCAIAEKLISVLAFPKFFYTQWQQLP